MAQYLVSRETGESLLITPENLEMVQKEYEASPDLYSLEEDMSAKDVAEQEKANLPMAIKQAQQEVMAEEEANQSTPVTLLKNVIRMAAPYTVEEMEAKDRWTGSGSIRDFVRNATLLMPQNIIPRAFAVGAGLLGQDILAQKEFQGEVDPTRTAVVGGLSMLPGASQVAMKVPAVQAGTTKIGDFIKQRASRQLYGSTVPKEKYVNSPNPITPEKLEEVFLRENRIPIVSTEANAFKAMDAFNDAEIARKGAIRTNIAQDVATPVNVLKYDFDTQGGLMLGAISDAKANVSQQMGAGRITPERGTKMLRELDRQDRLVADVYGSGNVNAEKATNLVTSIGKDAKSFVTPSGAGTPKSEALREYAMAINGRIEQVSPELRDATRAMAPNYAVMAPIEERLGKATTMQPTSGIGSVPVVNEFVNLWTTFNRRPQGAQLKYNIGDLFIQGSPILREALGYSQATAVPFEATQGR